MSKAPCDAEERTSRIEAPLNGSPTSTKHHVLWSNLITTASHRSMHCGNPNYYKKWLAISLYLWANPITNLVAGLGCPNRRKYKEGDEHVPINKRRHTGENRHQSPLVPRYIQQILERHTSTCGRADSDKSPHRGRGAANVGENVVAARCGGGDDPGAGPAGGANFGCGAFATH